MNVSAIIPVHNEPQERIEATVKSAQLAFAREVIVINDGSAHAPHQPIAALMWSQEHAGIAAALNHGIRRAAGEYVCWMGCGDSWDPEKIEIQFRFMEALGVLACFHDYRSHGEEVLTRADWASRLATDNQFSGATVMVRRDLAARFPFDENLSYCSDWDFACRVQYDGPGWKYLPAVLGEATEYPDGHTQRSYRDVTLRELRARNRAKVARRWRRG